MVSLSLGLLAAGQQPGAAMNEAKSVPVFAQAEAVHLMGEMRQALESNNRNAFLKLFDAGACRATRYSAIRLRSFLDDTILFKLSIT